MADNQSTRSRSGFPVQARLGIVEVTRIAEMAYRHAAWLGWESEANDQFAESVLNQFEALLADHAELAGYPIRAIGYGTRIGQMAAKVPIMWRPGWHWPGRYQPLRKPDE